MKTSSIFYSILIAGTALACMTNCSGNKKEEASTDEHAGHDTADSSSTGADNKPQFEVEQAFQQQLASVFTSYVGLKDAFVASDVAKIKSEAQKTESVVATVDMKLLSGAAHNDWMAYLTPMQTALKDIQASGDLAAQRKSFSTLSDNLYKSVKAFGLGGKEAYYEFCPMAFNNAGGYWLSDAAQIRNPYFGDEMLTCGSVQEKLN